MVEKTNIYSSFPFIRNVEEKIVYNKTSNTVIKVL